MRGDAAEEGGGDGERRCGAVAEYGWRGYRHGEMELLKLEVSLFIKSVC